MSINKYNPTTGSLEAISQGRVWVGTKAEWEATVQSGSYPKNVLVAITDDEQEVQATDVTSQLGNITNCNLIAAYKLGNLLFVNGETNTSSASGTLFTFDDIGKSARAGRAPISNVNNPSSYGQISWGTNESIVSYSVTSAAYNKFNFVIPLA